MESLALFDRFGDIALLLGLSATRVAVAFLLVPLFTNELIPALVRNAMFMSIALLSLMLQTEVYKRIAPIARVRDIGTPGQILGCVVAIEKSSDEQARAVMLAAMAAHPWMKIVVVVDADVDPHDPEEVMWALHTRCRPDSGVHVVPGVPSFPRADIKPVHSGKLALDATVPMAMREVLQRRRFPGLESIDLADYVVPRTR